MKNKKEDVSKFKTLEELKEYLEKRPSNIKEWLEEYIQWPIERFWESIINFPREVKWYFQRANRGWSDCDAWGGYVHMAEVNLGIINELIKEDFSYPCNLESKEDWNVILKQMAYPFETIVKEELAEDCHIRTQRQQKKFIKGLNLYKKYFEDLWS